MKGGNKVSIFFTLPVGWDFNFINNYFVFFALIFSDLQVCAKTIQYQKSPRYLTSQTLQTIILFASPVVGHKHLYKQFRYLAFMNCAYSLEKTKHPVIIISHTFPLHVLLSHRYPYHNLFSQGKWWVGGGVHCWL